jgi:hypothetical protein
MMDCQYQMFAKIDIMNILYTEALNMWYTIPKSVFTMIDGTVAC